MVLIKKDIDLIREVVKDALNDLDQNSIEPIRVELEKINSNLSTKASKTELDKLKSRVDRYHPAN